MWRKVSRSTVPAPPQGERRGKEGEKRPRNQEPDAHIPEEPSAACGEKEGRRQGDEGRKNERAPVMPAEHPGVKAHRCKHRRQGEKRGGGEDTEKARQAVDSRMHGSGLGQHGGPAFRSGCVNAHREKGPQPQERQQAA